MLLVLLELSLLEVEDSLAVAASSRSATRTPPNYVGLVFDMLLSMVMFHVNFAWENVSGWCGCRLSIVESKALLGKVPAIPVLVMVWTPQSFVW